MVIMIFVVIVVIDVNNLYSLNCESSCHFLNQQGGQSNIPGGFFRKNLLLA